MPALKLNKMDRLYTDVKPVYIWGTWPLLRPLWFGTFKFITPTGKKITQQSSDFTENNTSVILSARRKSELRRSMSTKM